MQLKVINLCSEKLKYVLVWLLERTKLHWKISSKVLKFCFTFDQSFEAQSALRKITFSTVFGLNS